MTERDGTTGSPARRAGIPLPAGSIEIALDPRLRGRFAEMAAGRILVIDFLITQPVPQLPTGELSARWERRRPAGFLVAPAIEGVTWRRSPLA